MTDDERTAVLSEAYEAVHAIRCDRERGIRSGPDSFYGGVLGALDVLAQIDAPRVPHPIKES